MIQFERLKSGKERRLVLTPNCSISWRQLVLFYIGTCVLAILIGLFFTLQGQWLVLPFSGIEMLALGGALYVTSRKVHHREIITVDSSNVRVEKGVHNVDNHWVFDRDWIRLLDELTASNQPRRVLSLGSHGSYVEVGKFLSDLEKDELAFRIKDCIIPA